jgi:YD repeat-containing protein
MSIGRGWLLIAGLMACSLLVGSVYFLWMDQKSVIVDPASPTAVNTPASPHIPNVALPAPTPDAAPTPQPQASSGPAPTYQYNAQGQLQLICYPDGTVYTYQYSAQGDKIRETSNRTGKTWTYVYDQDHHPLTIIDPNGHITHQEAPHALPNPN